MWIAGAIIFGLAASALALVMFNVLGWRRVGSAASAEPVSILIPARNEEANLPACLESALEQPAVTEILVADDGSTDGTAAVIASYAALDSRVRLVRPGPLPDGWCGKSHACHALAAAARSPWMLFLDADARLGPGGASRMVAAARERQVTFLSCWPQLVMHGFAEKLLMPMLNFVLLTLYPAPLAARRNDPALGLGHGACILMHRETYHAVGGHSAVRDELFEDTRLARLWRERSQRSLCLDGTGTVRVRMYDSFPAIWRGFRKNLFPAFRTQGGFAAFMLLHLLVFLAPFVPATAALDGSTWTWWFTGAAVCVMTSRLLLARRFGHPLWSALLHPLAEAVLLLIAAASWYRVTFGRGVDWKGRAYRASVASAAAASAKPVKEAA